MLETCHTTQAVKTTNTKLQFYQLGIYKPRLNCDPHHKIHTVEGKRYKHRVDLEDYWANLTDEFAVTRKMWSKMLVDFIRRCNIFPVPNQVKDNGEYVLPQYEQEKDKPILAPSWSQLELIDINTLMKEVIDNSRWWIDQ